MMMELLIFCDCASASDFLTLLRSSWDLKSSVYISDIKKKFSCWLILSLYILSLFTDERIYQVLFTAVFIWI